MIIIEPRKKETCSMVKGKNTTFIPRVMLAKHSLSTASVMTAMRNLVVLFAVLSSVHSAPPFRKYKDVAPPEGRETFVPPDIKYWAYGEVNTTVFDELGLPWYCYTTRQTHCIPLFKKPARFRTTRRPYHRPNQIRQAEVRRYSSFFLHLFI